MRFLGLRKIRIKWISHYVNTHLMLIYSSSAYYSLSAKIRTKWIIGRTKWIVEYFSYLALVEYRNKWIPIKWGPGVQTAGYNGARTVYRIYKLSNMESILISFIPSLKKSKQFSWFKRPSSNPKVADSNLTYSNFFFSFFIFQFHYFILFYVILLPIFDKLHIPTISRTLNKQN